MRREPEFIRSTTQGQARLTRMTEIDRATDNLMKSGKWFAGMAGRRESMPSGGRSEYGGGGTCQAPQCNANVHLYSSETRPGASSRHHSVSEYDGGRPSSAASSGLQGFYQAQRFQPRQSEAEQMMQAKRRMAAARERELRNYHQEQQYNRSKGSAEQA